MYVLRIPQHAQNSKLCPYMLSRYPATVMNEEMLLTVRPEPKAYNDKSTQRILHRRRSGSWHLTPPRTKREVGENFEDARSNDRGMRR